MAMDVLLVSASGAATAEFRVGKRGGDAARQLPVVLTLLGSVDSGKAVKVEYENGASWTQLKKGRILLDAADAETVVSEPVQLDEATNYLVIDFPGKFRVNRAADAGTCGVGIS